MVEPPPASRPALLLVLHDVSPGSWRAYLPFVAAIDALGHIPITWLVVPDFHKCHPLDSDPALLRLLNLRLNRGDELVLHGYQHCDDGPTPRNPIDYFTRRIYTHEGEFQTLTCQQALSRLDAGIDAFRRHQWPLQGFVAPGWLMSPGTRQALRQRALHYTSDRKALYWLPDFNRFQAPSLVWSARSPWRRGASWLINQWQLRQWRGTSVIRLGLHPVDMHHALARNYWLSTVQRLLNEGREPLTKYQWLAGQASSFESSAESRGCN